MAEDESTEDTYVKDDKWNYTTLAEIFNRQFAEERDARGSVDLISQKEFNNNSTFSNSSSVTSLKNTNGWKDAVNISNASNYKSVDSSGSFVEKQGASHSSKSKSIDNSSSYENKSVYSNSNTTKSLDNSNNYIEKQNSSNSESAKSLDNSDNYIEKQNSSNPSGLVSLNYLDKYSENENLINDGETKLVDSSKSYSEKSSLGNPNSTKSLTSIDSFSEKSNISNTSSTKELSSSSDFTNKSTFSNVNSATEINSSSDYTSSLGFNNPGSVNPITSPSNGNASSLLDGVKYNDILKKTKDSDSSKLKRLKTPQEETFIKGDPLSYKERIDGIGDNGGIVHVDVPNPNPEKLSHLKSPVEETFIKDPQDYDTITDGLKETDGIITVNVKEGDESKRVKLITPTDEVFISKSEHTSDSKKVDGIVDNQSWEYWSNEKSPVSIIDHQGQLNQLSGVSDDAVTLGNGNMFNVNNPFISSITGVSENAENDFATGTVKKVINAAEKGLDKAVTGGLYSSLLSSGTLAGLWNKYAGTDAVRVKDPSNSIWPEFSNELSVVQSLYDKASSLFGFSTSALNIKSIKDSQQSDNPLKDESAEGNYQVATKPDIGLGDVIGTGLSVLTGNGADSLLSNYSNKITDKLSSAMSSVFGNNDDSKFSTKYSDKINNGSFLFYSKVDEIKNNKLDAKDATHPFHGRVDIDLLSTRRGLGFGINSNYAVCIYPMNNSNDKCYTSCFSDSTQSPVTPYFMVFKSGWVPCVSVNVSLDNMFTENVTGNELYSTEVPMGITRNYKLSTTIIETGTNGMYRYLEEYKKWIFPNYPTNLRLIRPITLIGSVVRVLFYDTKMDRVFDDKYIAYPNINQIKVSEATRSISTITIDWNVVGIEDSYENELDDWKIYKADHDLQVKLDEAQSKSSSKLSKLFKNNF